MAQIDPRTKLLHPFINNLLDAPNSPWYLWKVYFVMINNRNAQYKLRICTKSTWTSIICNFTSLEVGHSSIIHSTNIVVTCIILTNTWIITFYTVSINNKLSCISKYMFLMLGCQIPYGVTHVVSSYASLNPGACVL